MLREAPYAFGSTYAEAVTFTDADWQARATRLATDGDNVMYVADAGDAWLASAGGYVDEDTGLPNVFGVWTRPDARGGRVAEECVRAVLAWARDRGATEIRLWATDGNAAATRLYDRLGFARTGAVQPLPSDETRTESEYALRLR